MSLSYQAMQFARDVHRDQKRKYTGDPYFTHLAQVAGIVSTVECDERYLATCWLHDSIEDQNVSHRCLGLRFGDVVAAGVLALTDRGKGNRAERKRLARLRLASSPSWVQTIKCADLISNAESIFLHDPGFAKTFAKEMWQLLDVLGFADSGLLGTARHMIVQSKLYPDYEARPDAPPNPEPPAAY